MRERNCLNSIYKASFKTSSIRLRQDIRVATARGGSSLCFISTTNRLVGC